MDFIRRDPVTLIAVAAFLLGALFALIAASKRTRRAFTWVAVALGVFGIAVVAFYIWFGVTQAR